MRFNWISNRYTRYAVLLAVCLTAVPFSRAQKPIPGDILSGTPSNLDPIFSTVPFNQWMAAPDQTQIPFKGDASLPLLSDFQRLRVTMSITIDGREIAKRPAAGRLLFLLQFTDTSRHIYQGHGEVQLKEMTTTIKKADLIYSHNLLVMPGDYLVAMAIFDTETGEHGILRKTMRVAPLKDDPLPELWQGIPPVEFIESNDAPDMWFQPALKGRLHLPLETRAPARIELLMILPSERGTGDYHNRIMTKLVSGLKTFSEIDVRNGSLSAAVFDLTRRRVSYEQSLKPANVLDWSRLSAALGEANPGVIDVGSLANSGKSVDFFLKEMGRRIQSAQPKTPPRHIMVILSAPMGFSSDTEIHPIELDENPGMELYYLRFHVTLDRRPEVVMPPSRTGGHRGTPGRFPPSDNSRLGLSSREGVDSLEGTLKPLAPRLFDIRSPEEFRKALAAMLTEISNR
jgi:hypothetical protein